MATNMPRICPRCKHPMELIHINVLGQRENRYAYKCKTCGHMGRLLCHAA